MLKLETDFRCSKIPFPTPPRIIPAGHLIAQNRSIAHLDTPLQLVHALPLTHDI